MAQPTAIRIDAGQYPTFLFNQYGSPGPYLNPSSSEWWEVGCELDDANLLWLVAYKTTDGGLTWTRDSRGPRVKSSGKVGIGCEFYPGTGTTIYLAYQNASNVLKHNTFDMVTGFGTEITGASVSSLITVYLTLDESGNPLIAWDTFTSSHQRVKAAVISGGAFGATFDVSPNDGRDNYLEVAAKSATYAQVLFTKRNAAGTDRESAKLATIIGGAVSSTYQLVTDPFLWWKNRAPSGPAIYDPASNKLGFPIVTHHTTGSLPDEVHMVVVSDPEGTPSDADITVFVSGDLDIAELMPPIVAKITGGYQTFWSQRSPSPFVIGETIRTSTCPTLDGTWSAGAIYFDLNQSGLPPTTLAQKIRSHFVGVINGVPKVTIGLTALTLWTVDSNYYSEQFVQFYLNSPIASGCRYRVIQ